MAGLVAAIHVGPRATLEDFANPLRLPPVPILHRRLDVTTWMPGTSPGMTAGGDKTARNACSSPANKN